MYWRIKTDETERVLKSRDTYALNKDIKIWYSKFGATLQRDLKTEKINKNENLIILNWK